MSPSQHLPRPMLLLGAALAMGGLTLAVSLDAGVTSGTVLQAATTPAAVNGAGGGNDGKGVGNGAGGASAPAKSLRVSATVQGAVRPGSPAQLRVVVENPNSQDVHLRSVVASVTQVTSAPGPGPLCTPGDFTVSGFTAPAGSRRVLKGGTSTVDLVISLRDTTANQDRCKAAKYAFDVRASADQA